MGASSKIKKLSYLIIALSVIGLIFLYFIIMLFIEGKEAFFYRTIDEAVDIIDKLKGNDELRQQVVLEIAREDRGGERAPVQGGRVSR